MAVFSINQTGGQTAQSITINGNKMYADGKSVEMPNAKIITIEIKGDVGILRVDKCKLVSIDGNVKTIETVSGDLNCHDVDGSVSTVSGDVVCNNVGGSVSTITGDIRKK